PFTGHFVLFYLQYPWYRLAIALLAGAIIAALYLFLKFGTYGIWIRATTQDRVMAEAMGIPVPWVLTGVFAIGSAMAAAGGRVVRPAGCGQSHDGTRLGAQSLHRRRGRRHGQSRRFDPCGDLYQPPRSLRLVVGEPGAGGDRLVCRADPDPAVPADRPLCPDP